jgi:hypothetical protein
MFRIQTRADLIQHLVLCALVVAMGVQLTLFPPVPIPADRAAYESRAPRIIESAPVRVEQQTARSFFVPRVADEPDSRNAPRTVYGLVAEGAQTRTLEAGLARVNAGATRWGGGLAPGIGAVGYLAAFFAWRRVRPQEEVVRPRKGRAKRRR